MRLVLAICLTIMVLPHSAAAQSYFDDEYLIIKSAKAGNLGAVRRFLNAGLNPNEVHPEAGTTALHEAAKVGHTDIIAALIERRARIEQSDKMGNTPLIWAADRGHPEAVRKLIAAGAIIEAADRQGSTALLKAARGGHKEVVEVLIEAGADVNRTDYTGLTPLQMAERERRADVAALLRQAGGY